MTVGSIDHNLIDGYRGTEGETRGSEYVEGDPLFVNAAGASFYLRVGAYEMPFYAEHVYLPIVLRGY